MAIPMVQIDSACLYCYTLNKLMLTKADPSTIQSTVSIPVTIPQIAEGLRRLSKNDLETLELLLDKKAMGAVKRSIFQVKSGKFHELK